ncbi:PLP-dependent cysteine synthase family protein [Nocardia camponoti]|uniref:Cystathionine beta-synthase n=1 Tax=Nocardia camponoti TaxID=1616106 RepID=A0A917V407_9NOCA|nr:pyridoxal-phosphate dependent enzyme [Nocardia camponoti]GGK34104.1 cystathionine beta-synthase [Nocardia camponoti]
MTATESVTGGVFASVDAAIGNTPLVRLNRITEGIAATVYVKLEYLNPGGSVKDRAAVSMIDAAEAAGELRPGSTIVEATSGNTGTGLALVAAARGYPVIAVVPDKVSAEKIALLRAFGVTVHITPAGRPVGHPEHLRTVALGLVESIPGAWFAGQYDNPANPEAHRTTTGPEIWAQTAGRVTHYVAGIGTGGTVSGAGEFLKSVGDVTVVGADPDSSVYGGGDGRAWYIEAVGHYVHPETELDEWPQSYHLDAVDRIERIPDAEALRVLHRLGREEGLPLGGSSGTAVAAALRVARELGPDDVVVVVAPDSGRAYLSKYFNDEWLGRFGFQLLTPADGPTVGDVVAFADTPTVIESSATVASAREVLGDLGFAPVRLARERGGSVVAAEVVGTLRADRLVGVDCEAPIADYLDAPLPLVGTTESVVSVLARVPDGAVLVVHEGIVVGVQDVSALAVASGDDVAPGDSVNIPGEVQ